MKAFNFSLSWKRLKPIIHKGRKGRICPKKTISQAANVCLCLHQWLSLYPKAVLLEIFISKVPTGNMVLVPLRNRLAKDIPCDAAKYPASSYHYIFHYITPPYSTESKSGSNFTTFETISLAINNPKIYCNEA